VAGFAISINSTLNSRYAARVKPFGESNCSGVFIERENRYRLTPLSAFPAINKKGLHEKDLKLAMSLKGSHGRKYECRMILESTSWQPLKRLVSAKTQ